LTAVHEAVSNVIRHAHRERPAAQVEIQYSFCSNRIEIQVVDEGEPFDLSAFPELNPGELRIGGRGIYLMRTLMDELSCRPRGKQGNILRMVKLCGHNSKRYRYG
jgi:serine/threonine-protein kinase RsbW